MSDRSEIRELRKRISNMEAHQEETALIISRLLTDLEDKRYTMLDVVKILEGNKSAVEKDKKPEKPKRTGPFLNYPDDSAMQQIPLLEKEFVRGTLSQPGDCRNCDGMGWYFSRQSDDPGESYTRLCDECLGTGRVIRHLREGEKKAFREANPEQRNVHLLPINKNNQNQ